MAEEKTFFQYEDVTVTNSRFMVGSQTFAMSNITSVKASEQEPKRFWPIALVVIGVLVLMGSVGVGLAIGGIGVKGLAEVILGYVGIGLAIGGIGVAWLLKQKTMYHVMLTTAGGETSALSSEQREYITKVVQALNEAIVARG